MTLTPKPALHAAGMKGEMGKRFRLQLGDSYCTLNVHFIITYYFSAFIEMLLIQHGDLVFLKYSHIISAVFLCYHFLKKRSILRCQCIIFISLTNLCHLFFPAKKNLMIIPRPSPFSVFKTLGLSAKKFFGGGLMVRRGWCTFAKGKITFFLSLSLKCSAADKEI